MSGAQASGKASILIIDDDDLVRATLKVALEDAGYHVREAADGEEGVAQFRTAPADLVLCDIFMPGMEGIETIRMLRERRASVPIIVISGGGSRGEMSFLEAAKKLGANDALAKPFAMSEVVATVQRYLTK
jgi:DNA-binding response OmpR family regulator